MANVEKIIEKMKNQPNGIRMAEADKVLTANGYRLGRQVAPLAGARIETDDAQNDETSGTSFRQPGMEESHILVSFSILFFKRLDNMG